MSLEEAARLSSVVGVLLGLAGFAFGLRQYAIAQRWKRSELAASILEQLVTDPQLALACQMLDYRVRKMVVPESFREMATEKTFIHDWQILPSGLTSENELTRFDWLQTLYRDIFDHFFAYLERVNHYVRIGLIDIRDLQSLDYWITQIREPRFASEPVFIRFIEAYEYSGVLELMDRFAALPAPRKVPAVPPRASDKFMQKR